MPRAIWKDTVLAEADAQECEIVEGNVYFPPDAIRQEYFTPSTAHTFCPWKGIANYYNVVVDGQINLDAAWYYPHTKDAAKHLEHRIAFWRGVKVER